MSGYTPRIVTPLAAGAILSPEQGGTGIDGENTTVNGQVIGEAGGTFGAQQLTAGNGISIDSSVAGQITISAGGGGSSSAITTKTADYVATAADGTILVNAAAGNVNITLPESNGSIWRVKKIDATANTVTVTPASGTVDGAANFVWAVQWASYAFQSNGTNLFIF